MRIVLKLFCILLLFCSISFACYAWLYYRWQHLWTIAELQKDYSVNYHDDDTLRVVMIGDSWAEIHAEMRLDSMLSALLSRQVSSPVKVNSKGRGGGGSRYIYQLMFEDSEYGTKSLLKDDVDYCIVLAGINDAAANLGIKQYQYHMQLILQYLLHRDVKPVVVEIPDVDIRHLYGNKPKWNRWMDWLRSQMTGSDLYDFSEYREALRDMLACEVWLAQSVIYVSMRDWNGDGTSINDALFMDDRIHLNKRGYELFDSCIASSIAKDLQLSQDATLVNQPVGQYP